MSSWPEVALPEQAVNVQVLSALKDLGIGHYQRDGALMLAKPLTLSQLIRIRQRAKSSGAAFASHAVVAQQQLVLASDEDQVTEWILRALVDRSPFPLLSPADPNGVALTLEHFIRAQGTPVFRLKAQRSLAKALLAARGVTDDPEAIYGLLYLVGMFAVTQAAPTLRLMMDNPLYEQLTFAQRTVRSQVLRALAAISTEEDYSYWRRQIRNEDALGLTYATCLRLKPGNWLEDLKVCLRRLRDESTMDPLRQPLRDAVAFAAPRGLESVQSVVEAVDREFVAAREAPDAGSKALAEELQAILRGEGLYWRLQQGALRPPSGHVRSSEAMLLCRRAPQNESKAIMVSSQFLHLIEEIKDPVIDRLSEAYESIAQARSHLALARPSIQSSPKEA